MNGAAEDRPDAHVVAAGVAGQDGDEGQDGLGQGRPDRRQHAPDHPLGQPEVLPDPLHAVREQVRPGQDDEQRHDQFEPLQHAATLLCSSIVAGNGAIVPAGPVAREALPSNAVDARAFLAELTGQEGGEGSLAHVEVLTARAPVVEPFPDELPELLRSRLGLLGVHGLYPHQRRAVDLLDAGHNVVIATGTASGKTLVYNLDVRPDGNG